MTVLVWRDGVLASDGQVSCDDYIYKGTKIRYANDGAILGITGDLSVGLFLMKWYDDGEHPSDFPSEGGDSELIVVKHNEVYSYGGTRYPCPVEGPYHAWGSGRDFALGALAMGADARRAVQIANGLHSGCGFGVHSLTIGEQTSKS